MTSNTCPVRLACCCDKSPLQVSLLSSTPKPREGWRFWWKRRLDDRQHLDKKEPIGSWDEFVQPSADASSALCKLDATSEVWQSSNWTWKWCGIKGKANRGRIKLQKELIQQVLELWRIKRERGKATRPPFFSILVYCHSQSPTETVLQTSPTCRARSIWAHHTAVWPCTPLPNPSFPLDLLFNFAFWNCLILQLLSCAGMPTGSLLERHKSFKHSVQPQHSSRKTDGLERRNSKTGLGVSPRYKPENGMEYYSDERVGDVSYHQTSSSVPLKTSQISSGGNLPFTVLFMSKQCLHVL